MHIQCRNVKNAELIFNVMDINKDGVLNFREFILGLSVIFKENDEENKIKMLT